MTKRCDTQNMAAKTAVLGLLTILIVTGCHSSENQSQLASETVKTFRSLSYDGSKPLFTHNDTQISFENVARRKWDNPIITDLDKDGLVDIFIGENASKLSLDSADKNGHRDFYLTKEQAMGFPTELAANGLYIGYVGDLSDEQGYWRIGGETKSPTAAVIENVLSTPTVNDKVQLPVMLLENVDGRFIDATANLGIKVTEQTSSAVTEDFDNDGWSDILIIRDGDSSKSYQQILYKNRAGKGFDIDTNHEVINQDFGSTGGGIEAMDYDNDGDIDLLYANQRGGWHLYQNHTIDGSQSTTSEIKHNFIIINVGLLPKGKTSPQNAIVELNACGQQYIRMVGASSAAFSHSMDTQVHIGLGLCETIDSAKVTWSNLDVSIFKITQLNTQIDTENK